MGFVNLSSAFRQYLDGQCFEPTMQEIHSHSVVFVKIEALHKFLIVMATKRAKHLTYNRKWFAELSTFTVNIYAKTWIACTKMRISH